MVSLNWVVCSSLEEMSEVLLFACVNCSLYATIKNVEAKPRRLRIYESGKRPFEEWVKDLKDPPTIRRIQARLAGVSVGNLGDVKPV